MSAKRVAVLDGHTLADIQALVIEHGSIDRAAKQTGIPVHRMRDFCREHGIHAQRGKSAVLVEDPLGREAQLEQEIRELKRQLRISRDADLRDERIIEAFSDAYSSFKPRVRPARAPRANAKQTPHEALLLFSDAHAGEVVQAEAIAGLNEFNYDVLMQRMDWLSDAMLSFKEHRPYEIPVLNIASLGDQLGGSIHDELRDTNEMADVDVTIQFAHDVARWLIDLVPHFNQIRMKCVSGNHGRLSKAMPAKLPQQNLDYIMARFVQQLVAGHPSISVEVPRSYFVPMQVAGRIVLLQHGDSVRSLGGSPVAGAIKKARQLEEQFAATMPRISHHAMGHFHTGAVADNGRILMNPSLKGADEYVLKVLGTSSPAAQLFCLFHPVIGLVEHAFLNVQARP